MSREPGERFVDYDEASDAPEGVELRRGSKVVHERFGRGEVMKIVTMGEPAVILEKVRENKGSNFGYNARSDEYGDLVNMGVIDPTKVTRYALQNAASVASLLLTTEAMVAEIPKKEKPMPAGGGGGGGMGGMDF